MVVHSVRPRWRLTSSGERGFSEEQGAFIKGPCREMLTTVTTFERLHLIDIAHDDRRHGTLTELLLSYLSVCVCHQLLRHKVDCLTIHPIQHYEPTPGNALSDRSRDAKISSRYVTKAWIPARGSSRLRRARWRGLASIEIRRCRTMMGTSIDDCIVEKCGEIRFNFRRTEHREEGANHISSDKSWSCASGEEEVYRESVIAGGASTDPPVLLPSWRSLGAAATASRLCRGCVSKTLSSLMAGASDLAFGACSAQPISRCFVAASSCVS